MRRLDRVQLRGDQSQKNHHTPELVVYECACGFFLGLDAAYLDGAGSIVTICPDCGQILMTDGEHAVIPAEIRADDGHFRVEFNAREWLAQANGVDDILDLARHDWRGGYAAEGVAEHYQHSDVRIWALFQYVQTNAHVRPISLECSVDASAALAWLKEYRRDVYDMLAAEGRG